MLDSFNDQITKIHIASIKKDMPLDLRTASKPVGSKGGCLGLKRALKGSWSWAGSKDAAQSGKPGYHILSFRLRLRMAQDQQRMFI